MKLQNFRIIIFVLVGVLFLSVSSICAETIVLKSGKSVEGKLLEKTDKYIKIDFQGVSLTYFFDEIESIDGVKQTQPSLVKNNLSQENNSSYRSETAEHDSGIEYYNKEYGIKIRHPKEWEVFDRSIHPEVFKTLLAGKNNSTANTAKDLICALSCGKNLNNLNPLILLVVQHITENDKDLPAEDLANILDKDIRQALSSSTTSIIEYPTVVTINKKKFVRYIAIVNQGKVKIETICYSFVKDTKWYMITLTMKPENLNIYKQVFEDMIESLAFE